MAIAAADLLLFLVQRLPGIGRAQAMHLAYLADVEARRHLGQPLTCLSYVWSDEGPLDSDVLADLDELEQAGAVRAERTVHPAGRVEYHYFAQSPAAEKEWGVERALLEHVVRTFGTMGLGALQDEVRGTLPVRDARDREALGRRLRMEMVNGDAVIPGLELPRVWAAVAKLDAGQGKPHQEVFGALNTPSSS